MSLPSRNITFNFTSNADFIPGHVWLAGAGPGDPGLLTILALQGLRQADVILYDGLIGTDILRLTLNTTKCIFVGKRSGKCSPAQDEINAQMIDHAQAGRRVLRLKGGDPMIFGRAVEEITALHQAGVLFRIIPGITSGIGGLAYAGIPVTCRGVNASVTFITGHDSDGGLPRDIDWSALAKVGKMLVFFMAVRQLALIADRLMAHGRSIDEPVAIVSNASLPDQNVIVTRLKDCKKMKDEDIDRPGLVVVGDIIDKRSIVDWFRP